MRLQARPAIESDLERIMVCRERLAVWALTRIQEELPELGDLADDVSVLEQEWTLLYAADEECRVGVVVEQLPDDARSSDNGSEPRIIAAASGAFVRDEMPQRAMASGRATDAFLRPGDVLTLKDLAQGNSDNGVTLWLNLWDWDPEIGDIDSDVVKQANMALLSAFEQQVKGNNVESVWLLAWPVPQIVEFAKGYGLKPTKLDRDAGLLLIGARRHELTPLQGASRILNQYWPPRWHFAPAERAMLRIAVAENETNQKELHLLQDRSEAAINTSWTRIYQITGQEFDCRSAVVQYVRDHPEEIRPHIRLAEPRRRRR